MPSLPRRKTFRLRLGRVSLPTARYFVTECVKDRRPVFNATPVATRLMESMKSLHAAGDAEILGATIMPDHAHLLFALGSRLAVGQVLAKLKALARRECSLNWAWQDDGYERRLRQRDSIEDYGFYIFMNPYRAGLVPIDESWPWWFCPNPARFIFLEQLRAGNLPQPEWMGRADDIAKRIIRK